MPQISVIMPVFNCESFVAEAIESILNQTFQDFEFIILEDGSTDSTLSICKKYEKMDPRVKVFSDGQNRGVVARLNYAIPLSSAPLIARMDGDDIALPMRLLQQFEYMNTHPDVVMMGSRVIIIDSDSDVICEMGDYFSHEDIDKGLMSRKGQLVYQSSIIVRKDAIMKIGGYDPRFWCAEDLDLFLKLAEIGKIVNSNVPMTMYREHLNKVGVVHLKEQELLINNILKEAYIRRGIPLNPEILANSCRQPESEFELTVKWGWWALGAKHIATARKYGYKAILQHPLTAKAWRLFVCAIRGY